MTVTIPAYAKINLFLDVTGRRENGYHDILSLMQTVSLCDRITVSLSEADGGITLSCDDPSIPCNEKNLAYRAADAFYTTLGERKNTHIAIEKRIPVSAGLAGGSTDAAAVLIALNHLFGDRLSVEALCAIGKTIGADIPFCILGGTAEVRGIGDVLRPLPAMKPLSMVVAKDGEGVSTPEAYRRLDGIYGGFTGCCHGGTADVSRYERLLAALQENSVERISDGVYNVFEPAVLPTHSVAAEIKSFFLENGAVCAMMSGSGPSVFAIFPTVESASAAADRLNEEKGRTVAFAVTPVSRANNGGCPPPKKGALE